MRATIDVVSLLVIRQLTPGQIAESANTPLTGVAGTAPTFRSGEPALLPRGAPHQSDALDHCSPQRSTSPRWPRAWHAATKTAGSAVLNVNIS